MKVKWEVADKEYGQREIALTPRYYAALIEVMKAEVEMMRSQDKYPDCWHYGRCHITDMANGPRFEFGGVEDMPDDGLGQFAIVLDG